MYRFRVCPATLIPAHRTANRERRYSNHDSSVLAVPGVWARQINPRERASAPEERNAGNIDLCRIFDGNFPKISCSSLASVSFPLLPRVDSFYQFFFSFSFFVSFRFVFLVPLVPGIDVSFRRVSKGNLFPSPSRRYPEWNAEIKRIDLHAVVIETREFPRGVRTRRGTARCSASR